MLQGGVPVDRITMSSDGNGAYPVVDADHNTIGPRYLPASTLYTEWRAIVEEGILPLAEALKIITSTPAGVLRLNDRKGRVFEGADADLVVLEKDLSIRQVWARGRLMVDEGQAIVFGNWEKTWGLTAEEAR
jgi:beta-aspartyl-dipeptidase (metallo-type)